MERSTKATHQETRAHNERLVLGTIYDRGPISRAEVARATGLTRTTVSDVVAGLIEDGLARESGRGPSTGGKAPILLEVCSDARHVIGLDLGDKIFRGAIVDLRGEITRSMEVAVEDRDGDRALARVTQLIDSLMAATDNPILGIGIGTAGLIDASTGTVLQAVNLDWRQLPLGEILRRRYDVPVQVANDSQAAAVAEHLFGGYRADNLVVVKVGQGIGAGLVLDGRLFQGDGYGAGEIGHTTVAHGAGADATALDGEVPSTRNRCRCGRNGCLETVASSRAILGRSLDRGWHLDAADDATFDDIVAAFAAGDPVVRDVAFESARALGAALAALIGALNVHRIVLLGAVVGLGEPWLRVVRDTARQWALPLLAGETTIELGRVAEDIVVRGATALLLTRELGLNVAAGRAAGSRRYGPAHEDEHEPFVERVASVERELAAEPRIETELDIDREPQPESGGPARLAVAGEVKPD